MKKWKLIATVIVTVLITAIGYGWYVYNKEPADTSGLKAIATLQAKDLLIAFKNNEQAASREYIDKILIVTGKATSIQFDEAGAQATIYLDTGDPSASIVCSFYINETSAVRKIAPGSAVRIKGNCTGFLMDVVLNKCRLIE